MNKDGPGPTNPMLYDPIPEGSVQTTKMMQFVAATAGNKVYEITKTRFHFQGAKTIQNILKFLPTFSFFFFNLFAPSKLFYGFRSSILISLISFCLFAYTYFHFCFNLAWRKSRQLAANLVNFRPRQRFTTVETCAASSQIFLFNVTSLVNYSKLFLNENDSLTSSILFSWNGF